MSIDSDMEEDVWSANKIFQRRTSLMYPKPLGTRESFHNRSLQDFSDRLKQSDVDQMEINRRRQSMFHFRSEKDMSQALSTESIKSENPADEWKQVINEQQM